MSTGSKNGSGLQIPADPGRAQESHGLGQVLEQQTPSTQNAEAQSLAAAHAEPRTFKTAPQLPPSTEVVPTG
jgi:hypothetical protein